MNKTLTLEIESKHAKSRSTARVQEMVSFLRHQAHQEKRRLRKMHGLPDTKEDIPEDINVSELVRMSSKALQKCNINSLLELLNNNGIAKYKIIKS